MLPLHPLNVLLAALFAAGAFALLVSVLYRPPVPLSQVERLYGGGEEQPGLRERLQRQLEAARFNITAGEFLRFSAALAVFAGLGVYLLTGALLLGVLGAVLGGGAYWIYLSNRAEAAIEAYEEQLPQVVSALITGARQGGTLTTAAEYAAQFGPRLSRDDWTYIAAQLKTGGERTIDHVFETVARKRGSQLLGSLFELLLIVQRQRGGFSEALPYLHATLVERVKTLRTARTRLMGPIRELWIVCSAPILGVLVVRFMSPQFAEIYRSWEGQLLVLLGWLVDLIAFTWAYRAFSGALRRETNFLGALKREPRAFPEGGAVEGPAAAWPFGGRADR